MGRTGRSGLLAAAGFSAAGGEVIAFMLPLFAGATMRASPGVIGGLTATGAAASIAARPAVAALIDRRRGQPLGVIGALLCALGCIGFAIAPGLALVFLAAAIVGVGGAAFWTLARVNLATPGVSSRPYARLLAFQSRGALVGYVVGLAVVSIGGYRPLFLVAAAGFLAAAAMFPPRTADAEPDAIEPQPSGRLLVRLWPLLTIAAVTAAVESGLGLLLLIHLQRSFDLAPMQIAVVLAPGFLAFVLLPEPLQWFVHLLGRGPSLVITIVGAAVGGGILAMATTTGAISAAWFMVGVALAAVLPLEQAMVVRTSGSALGRGLSLYGAVNRVSSALGPAAFATLYGAAGWTVACLTVAGWTLLAVPTIAPAVSRARTGAKQQSAMDGAEPAQ